MAYNYFPATYQPYQVPNYYGYQPQMQPTQMSGANQQAPSSRMVEAFPVDGESAVPSFPVNNGGTVELIDKNDAFIAIKSVTLDGTPTVTFYDKRPPEPPVKPFDPSEYVRRDELETLVGEAVEARVAQIERSAPQKRTVTAKKEDA